MASIEHYNLTTGLPPSEFEHKLASSPLSELMIESTGLDVEGSMVSSVLIEIQGYEDISEPLQKVKDEVAYQEDEIFRAKKKSTILVHGSDGIRHISIMVLSTSLNFIRDRLREQSKYLFKQAPFFNNTLLISSNA